MKFSQFLSLGEDVDKLEKNVIMLQVLTDVCQSECRIQDGFFWGTVIYVLKKLQMVPQCVTLEGILNDAVRCAMPKPGQDP